MSDLEGLMARLERRLGAITAGPTVLDGGITNRNYRVSFAGRDCVVRLPGKDTSPKSPYCRHTSVKAWDACW